MRAARPAPLPRRGQARSRHPATHWTSQVTDALTKAHSAVQDAKAANQNALDPDLLADLRDRYDKAVTSGITHNRHRDWHDGNHPGYTLAIWLAAYAEQIWHFTAHFAVDWTSNAAERGVNLTGGMNTVIPRGEGPGWWVLTVTVDAVVRSLGRHRACGLGDSRRGQ